MIFVCVLNNLRRNTALLKDRKEYYWYQNDHIRGKTRKLGENEKIFFSFYFLVLRAYVGYQT